MSPKRHPKLFNLSMSLPRKTPWHSLPLTTSIRSAPPLLVRADFTFSSYTVHITDLGQIWTESLDRASILSRALREGTTIDPSGDASQLQLLLERLESALYSRSGDTELVLNSVTSDGGGCDLRLKLASDLPPPLPELEWTFIMKQGSTVDFTNEFALPLLSTASLYEEQMENLFNAIQEKDKVIEKLKNSLDDNKIGVDVILGARKRKLLAPFNKERFTTGYRDMEEKSGRELVRDFFDSNTNIPRSVGRFASAVAGWWKGIIEDGGEETSQSTVKSSTQEALTEVEEGKRKAGAGAKSETKDEDDDDFGDMKPLPLQSPTSHGRAAADVGGVDEETDDEDDLDARISRGPPPPKVAVQDRNAQPTPTPPQTVASNSSEAATKAKPAAPNKAIGKIGGRKAAIPAPAPEGVHPVVGRESRELQDTKTGAAGEIKKVIGKIGGKKRITKTEVGGEEGEEEGNSPIAKPKTATSGVSPPQSPLVRASGVQSKKPQIKSPTPEPEDEDERANRKRRLLENKLEAKKKLPQKKKRKF